MRANKASNRGYITFLLMAVVACSCALGQPRRPKWSECESSRAQAIELSPDEVGGLVVKDYPLLAPERLHDSTLRGEVTVEIVLDSRGRLCEAKALDGNPFAIASALRSLPKWRFNPHRVDGAPRPIRGKLIMKYDFSGARRPRGERK